MQILVKASILYLLLGYSLTTLLQVSSQLHSEPEEIELSGPNVCKRIEE